MVAEILWLGTFVNPCLYNFIGGIMTVNLKYDIIGSLPDTGLLCLHDSWSAASIRMTIFDSSMAPIRLFRVLASNICCIPTLVGYTSSGCIIISYSSALTGMSVEFQLHFKRVSATKRYYLTCIYPLHKWSPFLLPFHGHSLKNCWQRILSTFLWYVRWHSRRMIHPGCDLEWSSNFVEVSSVFLHLWRLLGLPSSVILMLTRFTPP